MAKKLFLAVFMRDFDTEQQLMLVDGNNDLDALFNAIEIVAPGFLIDKPKEEDFKPHPEEVDDEEMALEEAKQEYEWELESWNESYRQYKKDIHICGVNSGSILIKTARHSHRMDY